MSDARETVLIIEDDVEVGRLIFKVAENVGFAGTLVTNPGDVGKELSRFEPTVISLDLRLPGHDGIEILRQLGERRLRSFVALVSGVDARTMAAARRIGESYGLRILGSIKKPFHMEELRDLFNKARGQVHAFTDADLEKAIDENQFFLEFQPKVAIDGAGRQIAGAEALARWRHPTKGIVPPIEFIPHLEKSPLLKRFTLGVLRSAAAQRQIWAKAGHEVSVAVNVAAPLLNDPTLPDEFNVVLQEQNCPAERITLELTETGVMADVGKSMEVLTRMRLQGFGLSIDDFGTGYSSLVQLHRLPFNEVKVDRAFVGELTSSAEAAVIVSAIIDLGHNMGLQVCAEGVEDKATHERLSSKGCDLAQGYYYGKPMSAEISPEVWLKSGAR